MQLDPMIYNQKTDFSVLLDQKTDFSVLLDQNIFAFII